VVILKAGGAGVWAVLEVVVVEELPPPPQAIEKTTAKHETRMVA
jgi:hypothetical protein